MTLSLAPLEGALEARVARVIHLGFEVRIELTLPDGQPARAQLTRAQTEELELTPGDIVYVKPPSAGVTVPPAADAETADQGTPLSA
jgi:sulfate/thiosulfate transport system ATP-binding protein